MRRTKRSTVRQLQEMGIDYAVAHQAYYAFGYDAPSQVATNPYVLLQLNEPVPWPMVDRLGMSLGFQEDAVERMEGAALCSLLSARSDGHVYLPKEELAVRMMKCTGKERDDVIDASIERAQTSRDIRFDGESDDEAYYLRALYRAEVSVAELMAQLDRSASRMALASPTASEMREVEERLKIRFALAQAEAVRASLENKLCIITGGPGTGKTTIIRGVIDLWERKGARIVLCAPTGRAAKRLGESTERRAMTIHRTLEYTPETRTFRRHARRQLRLDLMVVDEASMIDTELMASLLDALPPSSHVLLVGDVDQLPSVGAGFVLHDLIESGFFKTIHLDEIYRQSEGSMISINAKKINQGEMPDVEGHGVEDGQDFFFIPRPNPKDASNTVCELVTERIPKQFGFDPKLEVQVLCPMIKNDAGVQSMNDLLQAVLTPSDKPFKAPFYRFSPGDKIMQTRNDYGRDVFNGDIGFVDNVNSKEQTVEISFEGRLLEYAFTELDNTALAYAMTVHKSQGSEYPAVVMPLVRRHYPMLQRNLLYTAVSRGKQLVVIVGDPSALETAVSNNQIRKRYTGLKRMLVRAFLDSPKP